MVFLVVVFLNAHGLAELPRFSLESACLLLKKLENFIR
jgi:hypothetical protein